MKTLLWFTIGVLASVAPVLAGSIVIQLTPYSAPGVPNAAVQIDLTINDTGGASDCTSFGLRRQAVYPCDASAPQLIQCIARQPGTRTLLFTMPQPIPTYLLALAEMQAWQNAMTSFKEAAGA